MTDISKQIKKDLFSANRRIERLEYQLAQLVDSSERNTGHYPSVCCYERAMDESKKLLKEKW